MSDFENINNAVVRAAALGGPWASLNDGWQSDVVGPRAWKEAIPPLWSSLLESYWVLYAKLYAANPGQHGQLADPKTIVPGGLTAAVKDLYAPITSAVQKTVQQKINAIEDSVNAKLRTISNQIGAEIAKGAQQQTYDWAWGLGGLAVGVGLLWLVLRGSGGRSAAVGLRGLEAGPDLYQRLISYLTQYDERQSKGKYHNRYAIGQYFQAAEPLKRLSDDPQKFAEALSKAFLPGFKPREVLLTAIAEGGTGPIKLYGRVKKSRELEADPTEAEQRAALSKKHGFWIRKYGISAKEATKLAERPGIVEQHELWREHNGLPAANSPLSRGHLLDMLKGRGGSGELGELGELSGPIKLYGRVKKKERADA